MPPLDPAAIAKEAVSRYDANGDGKLDAKELEASPALCALLRTLKDHDAAHADSLTAEDIAARVNAWKQGGVLFSNRTKVTLDGKPLADAVVTLEPEPYLGAAYHSSSGTTHAGGYAYIASAAEGHPGVYAGLFTVRISRRCRARRRFPPATTRRAHLAGKSLRTCRTANTSSIST